MGKYVYKSEKGIAFLDKKVKILELASISDLRKARKDAEEEIKKCEYYAKKFMGDENYKTTRTFTDCLGINPKDWLILKEDTFMWDEKLNDFKSVESSQALYEPTSWIEDEKNEFAEILLQFISANDLTSQLYDYLRDINTENEFMESDKYTLKLERLLHKELENDHMLEFYEKHYQKRKQQYQEFLKSQNFNFVSEGIH